MIVYTINYITHQCIPYGVPSYQYVQIGFEPSQLEELDSIAEMKEISRSELVRRMVDSELQ